MKRIRGWFTLAAVGQLLVACAGSDDGDSMASGAEFHRVSMEEGGACANMDCLRLTTVTAEGSLELKLKADAHRDMLSQSELSRVAAIVEGKPFRDAIQAAEPTCPPAFDLQITLELETATDSWRDPHATGCVSDEYKSHPYHMLRDLLAQLTSVHFPEVPPF